MPIKKLITTFENSNDSVLISSDIHISDCHPQRTKNRPTKQVEGDLDKISDFSSKVCDD